MGNEAVVNTSFDYEAVKELYERLRTVYVGSKDERKTYIDGQTRKVYVDGRDTRRVSVDAQQRIVYVTSDRTTSSSERRAYVGLS